MGRTLVAMLMALVLSGCANTANVWDSPGTGMRYHNVEVETVWRASEDVLRKAGSGPIEVNRDEGYLFTTFGGTGFHYGGAAVIRIKPQDDGSCAIYASTARGTTLQLITPLTESGFHEMLLSELKRRRKTSEESGTATDP